MLSMLGVFPTIEGHMEYRLWKVFASLGVPGLALGVFYMLYMAFNWNFLERLPNTWAALIIILFMVSLFLLVYHALTLWSPNASALKQSRSSVSVEKEAEISGKVAGRNITETDTPQFLLDRTPAFYESVTFYPLPEREPSKTDESGSSNSSVVLGEKTKVPGIVAGRDINIHQSDKLAIQADSLINLLEVRYELASVSLKKISDEYPQGQVYLEKFAELHAKQIHFLKGRDLIAAFEVMIQIARLNSELMKEEYIGSLNFEFQSGGAPEVVSIRIFAGLGLRLYYHPSSYAVDIYEGRICGVSYGYRGDDIDQLGAASRSEGEILDYYSLLLKQFDKDRTSELLKIEEAKIKDFRVPHYDR